MACRPKLPTGEKKPPKFQAPIYYPTDDPEQLQRLLGQAFGNVQDDLAGLHALVDTPPLTTPVTAVTGVVMAKAGDVLRLMPGPAGIQVLLPTARATNKGQDVSIIVQGATGNVTVRAVEGKVQGQASVTLTGDGLRVFRSDGGDGTATGAGGWWIVGRNSADSSAQLVAVSAGTQLLTSGTLLFSNLNGVSFGLSNSSVLTASMDAFRSISLQTFAGSITQSMQQATDVTMTGASLRLQSAAQSDISNANVEWRIRGNTLLGVARPMFMAGGAQASVPGISFKDSNGISWGLTSGSNATAPSFGLMALMTASVNQDLGLISHVGGNSVLSATRLAFSNASNVTWSLSTAAGAATVLASVNDRTFIGGLAAGTQTATSGTIVFSNSNDMSFGMSGSTQVTGSYLPQMGLVSHIGGNQVSSVTRLAFSNASNVTWSLSTAANAATVIASVNAGGGGGMGISAGTQSVSTGTMIFANSNDVTFGMSGSSQITASYQHEIALVSHIGGASQSDVRSLIFSNGGTNVSFILTTGANAVTVFGRAFDAVNTVSAGTQVAAVTQLVFADSNGVSFGLSGSSRITATVAPQLGLISHIGGNSVANATRLAFSDASNVTFSLSTAAGAATLLASVAAGGAGGIGGIAAATNNTGGRVTVTSGTVLFREADPTLTVNFQSLNIANVQHSFGTGASSTQMSAYAGIAGTVNRNATVTGGFFASKFQFSDSGGISWGISTTSNADGKEMVFTAKLADLNWYLNGGQGSQLVVNSLGGLTASLWLTPFAWPLQGNITANTMEFLIQGGGFTSTQSTASYSWAVRGGVYTLANSTQLSLVNSFLASSSATTESFATRNSRIAGDRWLTMGTAAWSSSPVFSHGVNYWIGLVNQTAGAANIPGAFQAQRYMQPAGAAYSGELGAAHAASSAFGIVPFIGGVNTTNIPATIGTAGLVAYSNFSLIPIFAMRNNVARIS